MKNYYVYIMASQYNGTLYIGITSDLSKRIWQHKNKVFDGFTCEYDVDILVYFDAFDDPENAIRREKRLKKWNREWKTNLINQHNPHWEDLYDKIAL